MINGTPKSLKEAIRNGFTDHSKPLISSIDLHVKDFLAQGLAAAFLQCRTEQEELILRKLCKMYGIKTNDEMKEENAA